MEQVAGIVRGAMWSRFIAESPQIAIYVGGSDLAAGEVIFSELKKNIMPQLGMQVSMMLNTDGANIIAAAVVATAAKHLNLANATALVLGGTSSIGQRTARVLARAGVDVRIGSRAKDRADFIATHIRSVVSGAKVAAVSTATSEDAPLALAGANLLVGAGLAGTVLLPKKLRAGATELKVAIDLNPAPPAGIEGIALNDSGQERDGAACYGAIAINTLRLDLHKAMIARLFRRNDLVLDAEQIWQLATSMD